MLTKFAKWLLFITSYVPLYLLLILNNLEIKERGQWKDWETLRQALFNHLSFNLVMMILSIGSIIILICLNFLKSNSHIDCNVKDVKNNSGDILNYFITYLFPLLSMDINNSSSIVVNVFVFLIIGLLYVKGDLLYLNPMLILLRYEVIQLGDRIVITHKTNSELQKYIIEKGRIDVHEICNGIYVEKEISHKKRKFITVLRSLID